MPWTTFIDGGARGNPGPAAAGVHILDHAGQPFFSAGLFLGRRTSNEAEYTGLLAALDVLLAAEVPDVEIRSDSELMVRQLDGQYKVKAANLKPLYDQACSRLARLEDYSIRHVPREENRHADALVNQALDAARDVVAVDRGGLLAVLGRSARASAAAGRPAGSATTSPAPTKGSIVVSVLKSPKSRPCPAGTKVGQSYVFTATTPAGLCTEACSAVIEAVISLQEMIREGERDIAPMTVTCGQPDCGAVFQLRGG